SSACAYPIVYLRDPLFSTHIVVHNRSSEKASFRYVHDLHCLQDVLAAQVVPVCFDRIKRLYMGLPPKQLAQLVFYLDDRPAGCVARLKLHEHVHVTLRTEVVTQHRAEQREPPDVMALAEGLNFRLWDVYLRVHSLIIQYLPAVQTAKQRTRPCLPAGP